MTAGDINLAKSSDANKKPLIKDGHLFVLIHGLWGSPNHMSTIEELIQRLLPSSTSDKICTLRPLSFAFWKTYDGIQYISQRVLQEIFFEIEALQKDLVKVVKISIIGYSLGGLIARCVIGLLYDLDFFTNVKPVIFTTFATPHVGVQFFKENLFDYTANRLGPFMFGQTGKELFIRDSNRLLADMANPSLSYYKGLALFELRIVLSNVKNDRTVPFYTSFITEYSPFDNWKYVKIKYIKDLPEATIGKAKVRPKFVDMRRTRNLSPEEAQVFRGNIQEETLMIRRNRVLRFSSLVMIVCVFLPVWIPTVLCTSFLVSIFSVGQVRFLKKLNSLHHWLQIKSLVYDGKLNVDIENVNQGVVNRVERGRLSRQGSFKGETLEMTENTLEGIMYAREQLKQSTEPNMDDDDSDESLENEITNIGEINIKTNDDTVAKCIHDLKLQQENISIFTDASRLKLEDFKRDIIKNLNTLDWIKIPVFIDAWNSHDGIVARRGPKTNPKGTSTIGLWCSILRRHLKQESM